MTQPNPGCKRIALWTGPRNVSTALMYSFARRKDTQVTDEPYYGHYLRVSGAPHPGADEIMAAMECNGHRVTQETILGPYDCPIIFFKNMTHHMVDLTLDFLAQTTNILLTRNPHDMLPSQARGFGYMPALPDTGYKAQVEILEYLLDLGQTVPVLDSFELLADPRGVLNQLCRQIDIPFDEAMLHWPAGPKPEDGVWAKYWYHSVHQSTGFRPYSPNTLPFPEELRPLLKECLPYYNKLHPHVIKAGQ